MSAGWILVVEDDADILFTVRLFLESEGYTVETAQNGLQALELLATRGLPSLILLDMKMPVMNGWEFAKAFEKAYQRAAPIVVMTAAADAEQRAREAGAAGWVGKPFDLDILLSTIHRLERRADAPAS